VSKQYTLDGKFFSIATIANVLDLDGEHGLRSKKYMNQIPLGGRTPKLINHWVESDANIKPNVDLDMLGYVDDLTP
jgi:hypothetical protein